MRIRENVNHLLIMELNLNMKTNEDINEIFLYHYVKKSNISNRIFPSLYMNNKRLISNSFCNKDNVMHFVNYAAKHDVIIISFLLFEILT